MVICLSKKSHLFLLAVVFFFSFVIGYRYQKCRELPVGPGYRKVEGYPSLIYLPEYNKGPQVYASAAILVEAVSGMILYAKNEHSRRAPASTTKILTAIVALEKGKPGEVVTVSRRAARIGGSSLWLKAGDRITLAELLQGILLRSGNDGCVALAEHIAGSEGNFVSLMNMKAREIGAFNSNFRNAHGLKAPSHYSTAFDLAQITRYAMNNREFCRLVATKEESIEWYEGEKTRLVRNTNKLLWSFAGADGVKTGTTNEAGYCLVASATRDGRKFISVVLNSPNRWGESARLLEYGFANFTLDLMARADTPLTRVKVTNGWPREVPVYPRRNLMAVIPKGKESLVERKVDINYEMLKPPLRPGTVAGKVSFVYDGEEVDSVDLLVLRKVEKDSWWQRLWRGRE